MKKIDNVTSLIMLVLAITVVVLSITLVNCQRANKHLRKTVVYQANVIDSLTSHTHSNTMYVGLVK